MLISLFANAEEISASMPVNEKSNGPSTLMHDQLSSVLSEFKTTDEEQTIDNSSSVLLIL